MLLRFATAFAAVMSAIPAFAADDPIAHFPAETGVIIRLSPPAEISAKLKAFLQNAAPQFAPISDQLAPGLGSLIGNPTLAGIDANRAWYVAVLPRQDQAPAVVFAAPASDVEALKKAIGEGYWFRQYEDWGIYSRTTDPFQDTDETRASIQSEIAEPLAKMLAEGELGVYLNVPKLEVAYGPQIERVKEQFLKAASQGAGPQGSSGQVALENNRKLIDGFLSGLEQTNGIASSVTLSEKTIEANALALIEPDSDASKFLEKQAATNLPLLKKLPSDGLFYFALAGDLSDLISASIQMSMNLYPESKDFQEKLSEMKDVRFQEMAGLFNLGDLNDGVYRGISLLKVSDPEKYRVLTREIAGSMTHVELPGLQQDVTFTPDAETVAGVKVDLMRVVMTPDLKTDPTGSTRKLLETMFGADGMSQRLAVVDGLFVQAIGEGTIEPAIKSIQDGGSEESTPAKEAFETIRGALPEKANLLMAYDLPRLIAEALMLAVESQQLPLPIDPETIRSLDLGPSYTGLTVVASGDEIRFKGIMPSDQVQGLVKLLGVLQQAAPRRNGAN